jgi:hypothetical protein
MHTIILIQENLAIPLGNIDYVKLNDDVAQVEVCTRTCGHRISFDSLDEAIGFFNAVLEMIDNFNNKER